MKSLLFLFTALVLSRLLPLPPNSEPLLGLAVIAPHLAKSLWVWFAPLLVMLASDIIIGFHGHMMFTYTALAIAPFISKYINNMYTALGCSWLVWHVLANFGQTYPPFSVEALFFDTRLFVSGLLVIITLDILRKVMYNGKSYGKTG